MDAPFDISADLDTPVSAYLKLRPLRPRYLLESVEQGRRIGRYSFIGFGEALELTIDGDVAQIDGERRAAPVDADGWKALAREALERCPAPRAGERTIPFQGGLVGASSFDNVRLFEALPMTAKERRPRCAYVAPRSLLAFDHLTRRVALFHDGDDAERRSLRSEVVSALRRGLPPTRTAASHGAACASMERAEYEDGVRRIKKEIRRGEVYQLVLSIRYGGESDVDPFEAYRALRLINPSPYMFYLDLDDARIVGSSPESLVTLEGRRASLRPIAGTRPRSGDEAEDRRREQELLADPKENAEHIMLVDLARNDLGKVAAAGSIRVDPDRSLERYSHVTHMVSGVEGVLAPGLDSFDLFAASFPAGTVVGAPKRRAVQLIDEIEPRGRDYYAGTAGYFSRSGAMDQAIAIRTLVFAGGGYSYQAGAGIVVDSQPRREHEEVLAKAAALERALALAAEGL